MTRASSIANAGATMAAGVNAIGRRAMLTAATAATGAAAAGAANAAAVADYGAPLVELHFPPGILTLEQKAAMIQGVTDVILNATGLPPDRARALWVQIFETAEGGWGVGGKVFEQRHK